MEGRGKGENTDTWLACRKTSRGLEAAMNEGGKRKKKKEKCHSLSWGQGRSLRVSLGLSA